MKSKDFFYKIILLGNYDSGKTNFISRYIENRYNPMTSRTFGMNYFTKIVKLNDGRTAKIQFIDTDSMERGKSYIRAYFNRVNGFIIMYNMTIRESFNNARNWLNDVRYDKNTNNIALVGNHADSDNSTDYYHSRVVQTEEGQSIAESNNSLFFETSNLTGFNVNACIDALINRIHENDPNKDKFKTKFELKYGISRRKKRGCLK